MKPSTRNNGINAIKKVRELFKKRRSNLICEERNRIREKIHKKKAIYNFLKEKEQKDSLTNKQKNVLNNINEYIKNLKKYLKEHLKRFRNYNTIYGLDIYSMNQQKSSRNQTMTLIQ